MQSLFWSVFSRIWTEYCELSLYLVRIRENTDQKKFHRKRSGTFSYLHNFPYLAQYKAVLFDKKKKNEKHLMKMKISQSGLSFKYLVKYFSISVIYGYSSITGFWRDNPILLATLNI